MDSMYKADILLVEDNTTDAELTIRSLKKQGLVNEVFHVIDGEEALDFIFSRNSFAARENTPKIKVILLDLKLPKVSGLEVLKEVKSNPLTSMIPVVILSSSREDPDIEKAYAFGANSYVVKPVNFTDFVTAVQNTGLYWLLINETKQQV